MRLFVPSSWRWSEEDELSSDELHHLKYADLSPEQACRIRAELAFCLEEISSRMHQDTRFAWLWKLKKRVATGCLKLWETGGPPGASEAYTLSPEEKQFILTHNPLLLNGNVGEEDRHCTNQAVWFRDIQNKVDAYIKSRSAQVPDTDQADEFA